MLEQTGAVMSIHDVDALLLRLISRVALFKHIDRDEVTALLHQASRINFIAGELVFAEGAEGHSMYVVTQGAFEVYRTVGGRNVHIARIAPGEHFGEIALLVNRPRSASVRAVEPSVVIRVSKRAVLAERNAAALLYRNMAQLMATRLVAADEEVILHKAGRSPAAKPDAPSAPPSAHSSRYGVVRR